VSKEAFEVAVDGAGGGHYVGQHLEDPFVDRSLVGVTESVLRLVVEGGRTGEDVGLVASRRAERR
jgi:hypothetical protein